MSSKEHYPLCLTFLFSSFSHCSSDKLQWQNDFIFYITFYKVNRKNLLLRYKLKFFSLKLTMFWTLQSLLTICILFVRPQLTFLSKRAGNTAEVEVEPIQPNKIHYAVINNTTKVLNNSPTA